MGKKDLEREITDTPLSVTNGYEHVTKCNKCKSWVFFDEHHIQNHSVGGQVIKKTICCDQCKEAITLLAWRCL